MCNPRQVLACVCCSSGFTAEPAQLTLAVVAEPLTRESPIQQAASTCGGKSAGRAQPRPPSERRLLDGFRMVVFGADKSSLWLARDPTEASGAKLGVVFNSVWSMPEGLSWWDAKHKVA